MAEKTPQQVAAVDRLKRWAVTEGNKIFAWGTPGDLDRCVRFYTGKVPGRMIKGFCADLHRQATGANPGQAPGEKG